MMVTSYYLSRCGQSVRGKPSSPPKALAATSWKDAYSIFHDSLGGGRDPEQFHNSMKSARDTFDILFDNGRAGWIDKDGRQTSLSRSFRAIHEAWKDRTEEELEDLVLGIQRGKTCEAENTLASRVKTEGGQKVCISIRPERNSALRSRALALHGLNCMACGFNFREFYGALGSDYIEVHHVVPVAEFGERSTDPKTDLVVLCANCHRMVHRQKETCLSLDELKTHIRRAAGI